METVLCFVKYLLCMSLEHLCGDLFLTVCRQAVLYHCVTLCGSHNIIVDLINALKHLAALSCFEPPLIIIDMGTATTITAIDKTGTYVGGCISPGPKISAEALSARTAQLPAISLESPKKAIGKNTIDAMRSGVMLGSACMVDGMIDRIDAELGGGATVVATGGIARFVLPMCRHAIEYDRDLLLKGLALLYENNCREK